MISTTINRLSLQSFLQGYDSNLIYYYMISCCLHFDYIKHHLTFHVSVFLEFTFPLGFLVYPDYMHIKKLDTRTD